MSERAKLSDIMAFKMPSEEQMRSSAERRMAVVRPTLIDNWPKDLLALSMPTVFVPFDKELAVDMFDRKEDERRAWEERAKPLVAELDAICGWNWKFFRTNSRSPKDGLWPLEVAISSSGKVMLGTMACSERVLDDAVLFKRCADPFFICLRDHIPMMDPKGELRCFVKDGELLAVAEYGLNGSHFTEGNAGMVRRMVDDYFDKVLKPRLHINTVVFDLWIGSPDNIVLIEINPYGFSDPLGAGDYARIETGIPGIALRSQLVDEAGA